VSPTAPQQFAARCYDAVRHYDDGRVQALDGVTIGFETGRFTAIMGPSGSGKSTLLQTMAGLDYLNSGRVFVGEVELGMLDPTKLTLIRRDLMGFVFQAFNLVPSLTAEQNIVLPVKLAKRDVDRAWFEQVIQRVGLTDRLGHKPAELSGGQQQRVAVARALVARPQIVFADEPTGNLDSRSSGEVLDILRSSVDHDGQTVVMVTHDPSAASHADRVLFLADGRIVDDMAAPGVDTILDRMKQFTR
jgi:putative ABC transport system ATP-binding protein